jgi:DNA ligase (NAD+)
MIKQFYALIISGAIFLSPPSAHSAEENLKSRYEELAREIARHDQLYYRENKPEISDAEYDQLYRELTAIEAKHPEWMTPSSASQWVGNDLDPNQPTSAHHEPMLSIQNVQTKGEVSRFCERVKEELKKEVTFSVEEKIDGVAISLQYENGQLKKALTRGNGMVGNDITNHARQIKSIPLFLKRKAAKIIEIRGEVYLSKENFLALNREKKTKYRNPRNGAAGLLNTKKPDDKQFALLEFIPHSLGFTSESMVKAQSELLDRFKQFGFPIKLHAARCESLQEIEKAISEIEHSRKELPYEIDGAVIKVNELSFRQALGRTQKAPRSMVAYKFNSETAWTEVKKIIFQKGKKGRITPIALLELVLIDGSEIKKVSLLNLRMFNQMDLRSGDQVLIEKRGRIIPKVIEIRPGSNRDPKIKVDSCPICRRKLTSGLYCDWLDCNRIGANT